MRRLIVPGIFAIVVVVLWFIWPREPRAHGHSLSTWLKMSGQPGEELQSSDARAAVQEIGERAVPFLLQKLRAQDPPWHLSVDAPSWLEKHISTADEQHRQAIIGFQYLGAAASSAIPEFEKMLYDTNLFLAAGHCLAAVGSNSLPALRRALMGTNAFAQQGAFAAVGVSEEVGRAMLPEIRKLRTNGNPWIAIVATSRLLKYAAREETTMVALELLQGGDTRLARVVIANLEKFERNRIVPALLPLLNHNDPKLRANLTNAIRKLDPVVAASVGISTNPSAPSDVGARRQRR
jgi:hypothetical protein